jgi:hypothetical protein
MLGLPEAMEWLFNKLTLSKSLMTKEGNLLFF